MTGKWVGLFLACAMMGMLTACSAAAPSQPKVTFHADGCAYQGPVTLPPEFSLTWVVDNSPHPGFIVLVVTLAPGKTQRDLAAMPAADPPPDWVNKLVYDTALQAGTFTKLVDLSLIAAYHGEPIFFACFFTDLPTAVGAVGPITIKK